MNEPKNPLIEFAKWLLKAAAFAVLSVVGLGLLSWGGYALWSWYDKDRHVAKIDLQVFSDQKHLESLCKDGGVVFVGYVNHSGRTIEYLTVDVTAHRPGRSTDILTGAKANYDYVTKPEAGFGDCWSFPFAYNEDKNPENAKAEYEGKISWVKFKD
jgi:hypothetical protein